MTRELNLGERGRIYIQRSRRITNGGTLTVTAANIEISLDELRYLEDMIRLFREDPDGEREASGGTDD